MTGDLRQPRVLLVLFAATILTACTHGPRINSVASATTPAGAAVEWRIGGEHTKHSGELFAANDTGVIVLTVENRLMHVRWNRFDWFVATQLNRSRFGVYRNEVASSEKRAQFALVSRFPHGLEGQLLADVLRAMNQESLDELPYEAKRPSAPPDAAGGERLSLEAFATTAAGAAARYADRRIAIADGYRRIGADFPAMGEHWLRTSELLEGRLDPARPTMLAYATINGQPTLVGTGFVVTTRDDERADHAPGWPEEWHEHSGLLAEESGARPAASSEGHAHGAEPRRGTRAWVLHIWTTLENPAGRYHADNWALPFARAGLGTGAGLTIDETSGRALSLAVGGDRFLRDVLTDAGLRGAGNAAPVDSVIGSARAEAERVLGDARSVGGAHAEHLKSLRATWRSLQDALVVAAGPEVRHYLTSGH
jgi:hypothetical protein